MKRIRSQAADLLAQIIHLVSRFHISVHSTLERAEQGNIASWKKNLLFLIRIYARILPRKENDAKDEDHPQPENGTPN